MGTTTRLVAEVVAIAHECDLALLRVNDFHAPPLPLGELPVCSLTLEDSFIITLTFLFSRCKKMWQW